MDTEVKQIVVALTLIDFSDFQLRQNLYTLPLQY